MRITLRQQKIIEKHWNRGNLTIYDESVRELKKLCSLSVLDKVDYKTYRINREVFLDMTGNNQTQLQLKGGKL